ncbi:methyltransferase [Salinibacterium sp. G-O1]|uniref:methyltransferase n=1 Tax=Salinibacterium sp. G-O1 TaxID=3046208 RepID=UPI0024BBAF5F|nr:methyltransferase [Salinibacterium sp. G-O1]MDJ0335561.1 methyltransferase [Salinibacterium sp. G-O1]
MSEKTLTGQTWVAFGPAGAVGSIHRVEDGYTFKLVADADFRASYPTLEIAKSALHAALLPGAEWPEFREH